MLDTQKASYFIKLGLCFLVSCFPFGSKTRFVQLSKLVSCSFCKGIHHHGLCGSSIGKIRLCTQGDKRNVGLHWQDFDRLSCFFHLHTKGPFTFVTTVQCKFCYSQAVLKSSKFQVSSNFLHHHLTKSLKLRCFICGKLYQCAVSKIVCVNGP